MLSGRDGVPDQFAAIVYAAHDLHTEAPAAALVIKTVFSRPMMPRIAPGNLMWDNVVQPHVHTLAALLLHSSHNTRGPRLGGVATHVATMLKNQPGLLNGGGVLIVPHAQAPIPAMPPPAPAALTGVPAFPVARRPALSLAA